MGTSAAILYAQWTADPQTLTFDGNDSDGGTTAAQSINTDASLPLTSNGFTRIGYTFNGWNTLANNSGTSYTNGQSYTMGTSTATLYAQWTANPQTLTFDGNGFGGGSTAAQTINSDATATLTTNGFMRTGYAFNGWNTAANNS